MKLKGNYDITESGKYIVIFEDESGEEWEVEFKVWVDKDFIYKGYIYRGCLADVNVTAKCLSPGFSIEEEVDMEVTLEEHIENNFNL